MPLHMPSACTIDILAIRCSSLHQVACIVLADLVIAHYLKPDLPIFRSCSLMSSGNDDERDVIILSIIAPDARTVVGSIARLMEK